jgi:hypothetical protein
MTTANVGVKGNNVIIPYASTTKRTREVDLTVTGTGWTTVLAKGTAYADSNNNWRLVFNICGNVPPGTRSSYTVSVSGVTFKNVAGSQSISAAANSLGATFIAAEASLNSSNLIIYHASDSTSAYRYSETVALEEKPTWADANMEGVVAADVWVTPVSSGVAGILPATNAELDDVTATRLGLKQYAHGTTYNGGNAPTVTCSANSPVIAYSSFIPYQMQDGRWRMRFNLKFTSAPSTVFGFAVAGISIPVTQAYWTIGDLGTPDFATGAGFVDTNNNFYSTQAGGTTRVMSFGDIELSAKPTWAY